MKIPFTQGRDRRGAARVRARQQARVVLHPADRVLRLDGDGRGGEIEPGARRHRRVALGRVPRRRGPREGHPRQDLVVHPPSPEHHDVQRQGRAQLHDLDPRQPGGDARRLRRGDAARPAGLRLPGLGRERVHRARRRAAHARPVGAARSNGITRDTIITLARELGIAVHERRITRDEVYIADEAFFTGTAAEVTPIRELDNRPIGAASAARSRRSCRRCSSTPSTAATPRRPAWLTKV